MFEMCSFSCVHKFSFSNIKALNLPSQIPEKTKHIQERPNNYIIQPVKIYLLSGLYPLIYISCMAIMYFLYTLEKFLGNADPDLDKNDVGLTDQAHKIAWICGFTIHLFTIRHQYETSRSVNSLLQICLHICSRSADNLQMIYRLSADHLQNVFRISADCLQIICRMSSEYLQNVFRSSAECPQIICRMSSEYLQNVCRASAAMICNLQTLCRRNQPILLNKKPTKCTNQTTFIKRQTEEVGLLFITSKQLM